MTLDRLAECAIDKKAIIETLREAYTLPFERMTFLTKGWASLCFKIEAANESYLLKLYDESNPKPLVAGSRDFYLPLTYQLYTKGLLPQIPCPVKTADGRFYIRSSHLAIVFRFMEGEEVGFGVLPDDVLAELATLVGRLHRSTGQLDLEDPLSDDYRITFERMLPEWLDALHGIKSVRPAVKGFKELLLPRRAELMGYLERLKELQAKMRAEARSLVVCHTDLHGGNLLRDPGGRLHILDWENAMLAPREHDLFSFAPDTRFENIFWPRYVKEAGSVRLDTGALRFYAYRRLLEDISEWLQQLLYNPQSAEYEGRALYYAAESVAQLARVEEQLLSCLSPPK